jgi:hypothetical protein
MIHFLELWRHPHAKFFADTYKCIRNKLKLTY